MTRVNENFLTNKRLTLKNAVTFLGIPELKELEMKTSEIST